MVPSSRDICQFKWPVSACTEVLCLFFCSPSIVCEAHSAYLNRTGDFRWSPTYRNSTSKLAKVVMQALLENSCLGLHHTAWREGGRSEKMPAARRHAHKFFPLMDMGLVKRLSVPKLGKECLFRRVIDWLESCQPINDTPDDIAGSCSPSLLLGEVWVMRLRWAQPLSLVGLAVINWERKRCNPKDW